MRTVLIPGLVAALILMLPLSTRAAETDSLVRSAKDGRWSEPATWDGGKVPAAGARVVVRPGHRVTYDVADGPAIRSVRVGGVLSFARGVDTRLDVGLIVVGGTGDDGDAAERNLADAADDKKPDAHAHAHAAAAAALEVGTAAEPIPAGSKATIRLVLFDGADANIEPAIICRGGRMDLHGAPMSHTWRKLGGPAAKGDDRVWLLGHTAGWRRGDRVIVTGTVRQSKKLKTFAASTKDRTQTEERTIWAVDDGQWVIFDRPLEFDHTAEGGYAGEVANLSRNVVVESADPAKARGHTMYHHGSTGSVSYAEFRHLGKEGVLGRYSLHFHLCGDSMRGASVVGASIWDSANRWITIHGTDDLVVRDCVGYRSVGHGFFLEDGTEQNNLFDRNLAVQAYAGKPLPRQALPFDPNDGAGFWWANSRNAFVNNVAAECDEYGYFFQAIDTPAFHTRFDVRTPGGGTQAVDVRTLPFVRFEGNEAHCQRRHAFNLGGGVPFGPGVAGVGPDARHPFVVKDFRVWNSHWGFHPVSPSVLVDGLDVHQCEYGVWRPVYNRHAYRNVRLTDISVTPEFSPQGTKPVEGDYPKPLDPIDDAPPTTVVTGVFPAADGSLRVVGTTIDDGTVAGVTVNGVAAKSVRGNYLEWEAVVPAAAKVSAAAKDAAGNAERTPHEVKGR